MSILIVMLALYLIKVIYELYIADNSIKNKNIILWEKQGEYIQAFGHKVFVVVKGKFEKPEKTLMLLHGFPESSYHFKELIEDLSNQFSCIITFDCIGFGLSDKPDIKYGIKLHSDTALKVLKLNGVTGCHFFSHDMGTSVLTEIVSQQTRN